ncbi:hypothetical protein TIFTF001_024287 [Ficus carica]|uniref:4Fe-4S ferredoxin-type domain-containing protein n=1 Tax=Ficus carica TaxID=3494 RepID=A0AA88DD74_FICCA|nr:hypothetical protein TIFTF001_024287 [Ficus carica]
MSISTALTLFSNTTVSSQNQARVKIRSNSIALQNVRNLVRTVGVSSISSSPVESLQKGNWVKLICGASFEDVVDIRNLSLVYTLAGVDCIDCAAEASVVSAVNEGIEAAIEISSLPRPWVMISVNDDEDLHFRKAEFDPEDCPADCSRPCQTVCPANAISLQDRNSTSQISFGANSQVGFEGGVLTERCYGCGRCFPICPYDKINVVTYIRDANATAELIKRDDVDALEIHTSARQTSPFKQLWDGLQDSIRHLRLVAVSVAPTLFVQVLKCFEAPPVLSTIIEGLICRFRVMGPPTFYYQVVSLPDIGEATITSMNSMYSIMEPHLHCLNLWQLDGRPMSGDIGRGATRASIAFALRLAAAQGRPNGFLQLAGGTNAHTVDGLTKVGLFRTSSSSKNSRDEKLKVGSSNPPNASIAGVAYGGYARKIVGRVLSTMQSHHSAVCIEEHPEHLLQALREALALVGTVKCYDPSPFLLQ